MAKFSDVFDDVTKQATKKPKEEYLSEGKYQIIDQGQSVIAGYTNMESGLYTDVPVIVFGDHTRVLKYVDKPLFLGADGVKLIHAKNPDANVKYLYYALSNAKIPNTGYNRHFKWLKEVQVPIPEKEMQQQIVHILDKVSSLISLRKQQFEKLDELVKARFVEMFGSIHDSTEYPYVAVKDFTSVYSGGTPDRKNALYWDNGLVPWVKTTELQNTVLYETGEHITQAGLEESSAKMVPAGTILIAMYGQGKTRGMTAFLGVEASTNQACACIVPSGKVNQKYLWYYFMLSYDRLRNMAKGGNQPNLNSSIIKNYPVLMPPLFLQDEFARLFEKTEKDKLVIRTSLEKLETLKNALMQEYFG